MGAVALGGTMRIGPYKVISRLTSGGMAEIYLATLSSSASGSGIERIVVIKRMLPHLAQEPELRTALLDEATVMARLRHPNIVRVHELGDDRNTLYLVMEYLRGESISDLMRKLRSHPTRLDPVLAVHIAAEICAGLHAAHELRDAQGRPLNLVHRDVSPQNVLITFDGEVKVLDFGIARFEDRWSHTKTGMMKGKFAYMAPEQFNGAGIDRRTDLFAVGVTFHELLTGKRLFARESESQTLNAILRETIPRPSDLVSEDLEIPEAIETICMRALERDPEARFATAECMRDALLKLIRQLDPKQEARARLGALVREAFPERRQAMDELIHQAHDTKTELPFRSSQHLCEPPSRPAASRTRAVLRPIPDALMRSQSRQAPDPKLKTSTTKELPSPPRMTDAHQPSRHPRMRTLEASGFWIAVAAALSAFAIALLALIPRISTTSETPEPVGASPSSVRVHIQSDPEGATVRIEDRIVGTTPCDLMLPRGRDRVAIVIQHPNFDTIVEEVIPEVDHVVSVRGTGTTLASH